MLCDGLKPTKSSNFEQEVDKGDQCSCLWQPEEVSSQCELCDYNTDEHVPTMIELKTHRRISCFRDRAIQHNHGEHLRYLQERIPDILELRQARAVFPVLKAMLQQREPNLLAQYDQAIEAAQSRKSSRFVDLPRELRDMIYLA
ncbi:hypothetical protein EJ08DRAFT_444539 [Tothia fuscella]|uniref:Uncharacterized protein n=1 Tax=Tothia fuscella TaxID=1048955 RepID=A0A9P4TUJ4_9PEZI|nr:hypothetical protein EJ08DRAFT_444539 [Tothia fuscella]